MERARVEALRAVLEGTGWAERTRSFAAALRRSRPTGSHDGLLLVGAPEEEPWHLTAHLADEARWAGLPELTPTLVRWQPAADAPPHLRIGVERLAAAARGETVLVVAPTAPPTPLLERVADARRLGATVLALQGGAAGAGELLGLAHETLLVPPPTPPSADGGGRSGDLPLSFDLVTHLVSAAAAEPLAARRAAARGGWRSRLGRALDDLAGG